MVSEKICQGRTVVITGAGGGLGRAHALAFAEAGASVVVNDINAEAAASVAAEIEALGSEALADSGDICSFAGAEAILKGTLERFGDIHAVVNNAGVCRDRMFVSLSEEEWDEVVKVHLKGHFCLSNRACAHWRARSKESGEPVDARIINTTSGAGLLGSVGQSNYSAAKAGIATLTLVQAAELHRYGVTANALAPSARTAMTQQVEAFAEQMKKPEAGFDYYDPANISPLLVWLGSPLSAHVTGRVFELEGDKLSLVDAWRAGLIESNGGQRWEAERLSEVVDKLIMNTIAPQKVYGA